MCKVDNQSIIEAYLAYRTEVYGEGVVVVIVQLDSIQQCGQANLEEQHTVQLSPITHRRLLAIH
jgi:hypothetical protein